MTFHRKQGLIASADELAILYHVSRQSHLPVLISLVMKRYRFQCIMEGVKLTDRCVCERFEGKLQVCLVPSAQGSCLIVGGISTVQQGSRYISGEVNRNGIMSGK